MSAMKSLILDLEEAGDKAYLSGVSGSKMIYRDALLGAYLDSRSYPNPAAALDVLLKEIEESALAGAVDRIELGLEVSSLDRMLAELSG